jgi:hypothetical protein
MNTPDHNTLNGARPAARKTALRKWIHSLARPFSAHAAFLLIPVFAVIGFGGCPPKKPVQPKFVHTGVIIAPRAPVPGPDPVPPDVQPPDMPYFVLTYSSPLDSAPRPAAVRRAPSAAEPEPEPTKPEAPQISPQLSPEEKSKAEASANADIDAAKRDLDNAERRRLNATQQDMADKIRSFLAQARDAIGAGDWLRAKNLAQKAHVLSMELTKSF